MVLFNFGIEDFVINMGDRIAQLIFEKNKDPYNKRNELVRWTDRGAIGYGSTGTNAVQNKDETDSESRKDKKRCGQDVKMNARTKNDATKNDTLSQSRQLITARRMSKLAKGENLVFLAIVRETNDALPREQTNKRSFARVAHFAIAHGMSKGAR